MIDAIDQWLIDRHQVLVNWSQRMPAWWIEQCAAVVFISAALRFAMTPTHGLGAYFILALDITVSIIFYGFSVAPAILVDLSKKQYLRLIMLTLSIWGIAASYNYTLGRFCVEVIYEVAFTAIYFFAACKPPAPKKESKVFSPAIN
jgi:hypothetical protein